MKKQKPETNINEQIKEIFTALASGQYNNFALMSCFINGEPGAAICLVHEGFENIGDPKKKVVVDAVFVTLTPDMVLTDHDGVSAKHYLHDADDTLPKLKERGH